MNTSPKMYLIYELKEGSGKVLQLVERNNQRVGKLVDEEYKMNLQVVASLAFGGSWGWAPTGLNLSACL